MIKKNSAASLRIAADVGGTFTDVAIFDEAGQVLSLGKTLSTPARLVEGIASGVAKAGGDFANAALFLHGTTVAINTLLERTGARTALLITAGFRDIYEIGRVNRPEAYNLFFRKHVPLVERALRFEVSERRAADGSLIRPLDEEELERIAQALEAEEVRALAILFLHSYRDPSHENAAREFFEARLPHLFISTSNELSQEYREFERASTTAANAYVGHQVRHYLGEMEQFLEDAEFPGNFLVVQSTGGLYDSALARRESIRMLESGPAAGVVGATALCAQIGERNAIAFDMGGTTAKAGVILDGVPLMAGGAMIGGYAEGLPVQIPMLDIQEVGTGGGSIARIGPGRSLRVGPRSAGAVPGPVCYGNGGTEPTVTDANLVLGRLAADRFLGGEMPLDVAAARAAITSHIGEPLGLGAEQVAEGILRIAAATMSNVVKRVTTERGLDARDFALIAYGGAGPLHAALIARELHIGRVIIPNAPGHFSAYGMLVGDLRRDYVRTRFARLADAPADEFAAIWQQMEIEGREAVRDASPFMIDLRVQHGADMRYVGQEHAVSVELPGDVFARRDYETIKARFDEVHQQRYGFSALAEGAEIVSLRLSVTGVMPKPPLERIAEGGQTPPDAALVGHHPVYFDPATGFQSTAIYRRAELRANNRIVGPALIEEHASTTVILPDDTAMIDDFGNIIIKVRGA